MRWLGTALLVFSIGCDEGGGGGPPRIDSLAPEMGAVGAEVDVLGQNFCGMTGAMEYGGCADALAGFVTFGAAEGILRAQVGSWKETRIQVMVPSGLAGGATSVTVTVEGIQSNAWDFDVVP